MYTLIRKINLSQPWLHDTGLWLPRARGAEASKTEINSLPISEQILPSGAHILHWHLKGTLPARSQIVISEGIPNLPPSPPSAPEFMKTCLAADQPWVNLSPPVKESLTKKFGDKPEKVVVTDVSSFLIEKLSYEYPPKTREAEQVLKDFRSDCGGYHATFVAILRTLGIPAVLDFGMRLPKHSPHTWAWWWSKNNKKWSLIDLNDLQRGVGYTDRVSFSLGTGLRLESFPREVQYIQGFILWDWHYKLHNRLFAKFPIADMEIDVVEI